MSYVGGLSVGLVAKTGVVMAAERRYTLGTLIASKTGVRKLVPVSDHIALAATGIPGDVQFLARIITAQAELYRLDHNKSISCKTAAKILGNYLYSTRLSFPKYVEPVVGGFDSKPRLIMLDVVGSTSEEKFAATGTGARIAIGLLEDSWNDEMDKNDARSLVIRVMEAGRQRDNVSGDLADIIVIEKETMSTEEFQMS